MSASHDAVGRDGERTSVMTTDHGRIVLTVPNQMTEADLEDFDLWIDLIKRSMRRLAARDAGRRAIAGADREGGRDGT